MELVADLHLHSKYSRAVSKDMVLPCMAEFARRKGIDILTTGDWTHPLWFREIKDQLEEVNSGVFKIKNNKESEKDILFLLTTEISSIYSQGEKTRRVHNLIFSPSIETCQKINTELLKKDCNLSSDGRPIIGISSKNLLELVLSIDEKVILIPAHAWTPWFALYGSKSGFDSIEECFGEYSKYIYAIETGLSSDPQMNWGIKELENRSLVSFSDAHSPAKMGREATVFVNKNGMSNIKFPISNIKYDDIVKAIKKEPGNLQIGYTIEFYPEEGKYHYDGHRNCKFSLSPNETLSRGSTCPVCKRSLTIGVNHRVMDLSDSKLINNLQTQKYKTDELGVKWVEDPFGNHPPFVKMVPLLEIIAESLSSTVSSAKVINSFNSLCDKFGGEIPVLLETNIRDIQISAGEKIADGISRVRAGDIVISPGFDGEYGKVKIWSKNERKEQAHSQIGLAF